ncbi:rhodanese-related sulfurtransferase [Leptolyngbya sp. 'hensonii']|uniref:rhodanese-like domain-containing protein n=1 Tax=Leptolyngbya sp. 'hensonii' TaxID=1922337 RepID=UPI00094FFC32|nr:rhodanese-like domain-containing protein [Leptolyngbya sp. 'hensonii']OLP16293.1 rhodanese-related sulfurtransferase [Leptolyngbya sp. 'hensonii']
MQQVQEISVKALAERMQSEDNVQLVDVREPQELEMASIEGFDNFPLSRFSEWGEQIKTRLDPDLETLVICHHGMRSAQMCQWLIGQGFTNVKNVAGGIDAYSVLVNPQVPRY